MGRILRAADTRGRVIRKVIATEREELAAQREALLREFEQKEALMRARCVAEVQSRTTQWIENLEPELLEVALASARKIVATELRTNPDAVRAIVTDALCRLRNRLDSQTMIRLNPENAAQLDADESWRDWRSARGLQIVVDAALSPGDVIVETRDGKIDARIETKFETLRWVFKE